MQGENTPPVKVNEPIILKVEGHGKQGDAFGKIRNYVIFLKPPDETKGTDLEVGKEYSAIITKVTRTVGFADVPAIDGCE